MDHAPKPEPDDTRIAEAALEVLRNKLSQETYENHDVESELARLRRSDPVADEMIRALTERYFPGSSDMYAKEKAVRMMLTAFLIDREITLLLEDFEVDTFFAELDRLATDTQSDSPESET